MLLCPCGTATTIRATTDCSFPPYRFCFVTWCGVSLAVRLSEHVFVCEHSIWKAISANGHFGLAFDLFVSVENCFTKVAQSS